METNKMHIWMLNHYAVPLGGKGASRHAILAKYLKRAGHEVTVFASAIAHGNNESLISSDFPPGADYLSEFREGVHWRFLRTRVYRNNIQRLWLMRNYAVKVQQSVEDLPAPDVVIGSCVHPYAVEAARKLAQRFSVPFIYEIRDIWPESLVDVSNWSRWHPIYQLFRKMELKAFRDADGVISLLPGMHSYVTQHGISSERICHLPNGIDPEAYPSPSTAPKGQGFLYSYFGAHGPANSLENILKAASLLKQNGHNSIRFQFIGDGACKQALIDQAKTLRLSNVDFLPPIEKNELKNAAEQSDGFVFNLKRMPIIEKYGLSSNKLFEYLNHARPIVFSCSSFNNPVDEAGAGISIPPEDPQAMAHALLKLSQTDAETRHQMGLRGRAFALQHHDLAKLSERLANFLLKTVLHYKTPAGKLAA